MIEILVDRLRWPAALVRERAASQLGNLIVEGNHEVRDALIAWIARQELESLAAVGLLPFLYAAARASSEGFTTNELASACKARSVLSELYLSHLDPSRAIRPELGRYSEPPSGWQASDKVTQASTESLEAHLRDQLHRVELYFLRPLTRQFDFEVSVLSTRHGESPARAFSAAGTREFGHHPGWQPLGREVRLSAFLRTLAWAASKESIPKEVILFEAASTSPVDLGLWGVQPTASPDWWPGLKVSNDPDEVDKETVAVLRNVENSVESWGSESNVVLAASGCLSQTNLRQYDLEVRAFFQRPDGPGRPASQELFQCLRSVRASVRQEPSRLRFEGPVITDTGAKRLADWLIVPCCGSTLPAVPIIWQAWRGLRQIQCPSEALATSAIHAVCRDDSIDYESGGGLIARWSDWSSGMSALVVRDLLPATGWVLVAPRAVVDRFADKAGMKLAWAWEVTSHFRDYEYQDFVEYKAYDNRGTSLVIRP